ncbi:MAG: PD-(D/E)XK nuclease family protein [Kofleriaceae bacterium]
MASTRALLHAPWSASKVAMALRCPRLFHFKYVDKLPEPEVMPEARIGKAIHAALELVLAGRPLAEAAAEARGPLRDEAEQRRFDQLATGIEPFLRRIGQLRQRRRVVRQLVEYSLAVREDLTATQFYAGDAYYRGVIDAGYLFDADLALVDHKTGVRHPGTTINDQLEGYAVLAAAAFRSARRLWLGIHWVADRAMEWGPPVDVAVVRARLEPALLDNIEAAALAVSDGPRTNPGPYCDRCSYRARCPEGQEQRYEPLDEYDDDDDD